MHKYADYRTLGRVGLALAGREAELDEPLNDAEKALVCVVKQDSEWMDERIQVRREKWKEAKRQQRTGEDRDESIEVQRTSKDKALSSNVQRTKEDKAVSTNVPSHPSIRPSVHPSVQINNNNAEGVNAPAHARGDVPSEVEVVAAATGIMGITEEFARWWYAEMEARDWRNNRGDRIGCLNWRSVLKSWWNRRDGREMSEVRETVRRSAAAKPRAWKPEDWQLCAERCANCTGDGCSKGIKTPPACGQPPQPPEECRAFKSAAQGEGV